MLKSVLMSRIYMNPLYKVIIKSWVKYYKFPSNCNEHWMIWNGPRNWAWSFSFQILYLCINWLHWQINYTECHSPIPMCRYSNFWFWYTLYMKYIFNDECYLWSWISQINVVIYVLKNINILYISLWIEVFCNIFDINFLTKTCTGEMNL